MASQDQKIGESWVDVKASLSLVDDQKYTFQNVGSYPVLLREAASEPTPDAAGHKLDINGAGSLLSVTPAAGLNLYIRLKSGAIGESTLMVTEAD